MSYRKEGFLPAVGMTAHMCVVKFGIVTPTQEESPSVIAPRGFLPPVG